MKAGSAGGDGDGYESPEAGTYNAVCVGLVDVGTQQDSYEGKPTSARKVYLFWELDQRMQDGRRFRVFSNYTLSVGKKANLRKLLDSWRGVALTDEQAKDFELSLLLKAPCLLSLELKPSGKVRVASGPAARKLDKKFWATMPPMQPEGDLFYFSLAPEEFDEQTFHALQPWLKNKIISSPEYHELKKPAPAQEQAHGGAQAGGNAGGGQADDIPF